MTKLRLALISAAGALAISLLVPAGSSAASAQPSGDVTLPVTFPVQQIGVPRPSDLVFDPYDNAYVISKGPPPRVIAYDVAPSDLPVWVEGQQVELPPGTDPQTIDYFSGEEGQSDFLVITDPGRRKFLYLDAVTLAILDERDFPPGFEYPGGTAEGFKTQVAADFGLVTLNTSVPGSLWSPAPAFPSQLPFGDSIHPNGVDLLPDSDEPQDSEVPSEFLVIDAESSRLYEISDAVMPDIIGKVPVVPGAGGVNPPRDVAVSPLNLNPNPNEAGVHPIYIPVPNFGQVFQSADRFGPWSETLQKTTGRPVRVDASCDSIAFTDFSNDLVNIYAVQAPPGAVCVEIAQLFAKGAVTEGGKLPVEVKASLYSTAAELRAAFKAGGGSGKSGRAGGASASAVRSRAKKVDLEAGSVDKVKLKFSPGAIANLADALQDRGRLKGKLKLEVTSPAGEKTTVTQPIVLRKR
jgi:hypothetical protein